MKESRGLREIHEVMEKIHEEEKDLTAQERIRKIREESETFLREHNIKLRRIRTKDRMRTSSR